jgi:heat shock protein HslJ
MACPPPAGEVEAAFFAALSRVAHVEEPERWHITLFDRDGAIVMRLSQRDRD